MGRGGIRVIDEIAVDLKAIESLVGRASAQLPRGAHSIWTGARFRPLHMIDIPPGGSSDWLRHMYDDIYYVLSGTGTAGRMRKGAQSFEFGPHSFRQPPFAPSLLQCVGTETVRWSRPTIRRSGSTLPTTPLHLRP